MSVTRLCTVFALVLGSAACSLGFGTPYPGATARYREFYTCSSVVGSWCYDPRLTSETTGGGRHGAVVGMRMGAESARLDARGAGGIAFDVRADYSYALNRWAAVGASAALAMTFGRADLEGMEEGIDLAHVRTPVAAQVTVVPIVPLVVRAGGFVAPGKLRFGDDLESDVFSRGVFAGAGMTIPFPGLHMVLTVEWQKYTAGEVATDLGPAVYDADVVLVGYWLVL